MRHGSVLLCARICLPFVIALALVSCVAVGPHGQVGLAFPVWSNRDTGYPPDCAGSCRDDDAQLALALPPDVDLDWATRRFLAKNGLAVPANDVQLRPVYQRLVFADDATLRQVLIVLGKAICQMSGGWRTSHRRLDLPDEFGARALRLATPLLELTYLGMKKDITATREDQVLLPMLLRLLETMQYEPALKVLMRPGGVQLLNDVREGCHPSLCNVWASFGRTAVSPLADLARSKSSLDRTDLTRADALKALGWIRDTEAVPDLQHLMGDPDSDIRAAAAETLREMGVAGGYGPPSERDLDRARQDVRDGKVSPEAARRDYGLEAER